MANSLSLNAKSQAKKYHQIEWEELVPLDDLELLLNPPASIMNIQDGSSLDSVDALAERDDLDEQTKRYYQALKSDRVVGALNNKPVKLPGFIVPLEVDEENKVTEFFVVPYFGACLHMPPPPPNQIVYAKVKKGFVLESLYNPYWFEGTLVTATNEHDLGNSAYQINIDSFYLYEE